MAELVVPFPASSPNTVCGMLRVAESFRDIRELMQSRVRILPGSPVFLHDVAHEEAAPGTTVALTPASIGQPKGATADEQFELRDEQGDRMVFDWMWIRRIEIPDGVGTFPDACRAVGQSGAGWMIIAGQPSEHAIGEP